MARRQEFQVTVEGAELAAADVDRLAGAIQKAVLSEFAGVDLRGDFAARILGGQTRGIRVMALSQQQLADAGVELGDS